MTLESPLPLDDEPAETPTAYAMQEMQLHGWRPYEDEADPRPLPDARLATGAVADIFDAIVSTFIDTRLEPDLEDLLWGLTNVFHRAGERIERELDDNEARQKRLQREQDGSEVASVELERALREGVTLIERRDAMEFFRDACADQFRLHTRNAWTPRSGSRVNRKTLTASVIDSRDFINARKWTDKQLLVPPGTRIAITAGQSFNDVDFIYATLDRVHAKFPDMVLLHGATPTGGERIAVCWADARKVPTVPFKPDWKLGRSAPFKRNDRMLEALPKGVLIFPGTGIQDNLRDKARAMGVTCWDFRQRGGGGAAALFEAVGPPMPSAASTGTRFEGSSDMNNAALADQLAADHGLSKADAKKIVDSVFAAIGDAAAKGEDVSLNGFGKFKVKDTPAREGRNPATGQTIQIAASKKLAFAPAKAVKDKLNG